MTKTDPWHDRGGRRPTAFVVSFATAALAGPPAQEPELHKEVMLAPVNQILCAGSASWATPFPIPKNSPRKSCGQKMNKRHSCRISL